MLSDNVHGTRIWAATELLKFYEGLNLDPAVSPESVSLRDQCRGYLRAEIVQVPVHPPQKPTGEGK